MCFYSDWLGHQHALLGHSQVQSLVCLLEEGGYTFVFDLLLVVADGLVLSGLLDVILLVAQAF